MAIENRKYVRYVIRQSAILKTEDGESIGFTRDMSARGVFFVPQQEMNLNINASGSLAIDISNSIITVPCVIRHISGNGIGIAMQLQSKRDVTHLTELLESTLKLHVDGETIHCTPDNRLVYLDDWNVKTAEALAQREGIILTDEHWSIINIMRSYYEEYRICPSEKVIKDYILKNLAKDQALNTFIYNLFPSNLIHQGSRLAGIPLPLEDHIVENMENQKQSTSNKNSQLNPIDMIEFEGIEYHFTKPGNLIEQKLWNERLAIYMAESSNLELTHAHWEIINFLRYFYSEYSIVPNIIALKKHLLEEGGNEWKDKANDEYLYTLFPKGPCRQGAILGGLPEPKDCID